MNRYIRKSWFGFALVLVVISLTGCSDRESKEQSPHPYDGTANAEQDISTALAGLKGQKRLLLIFGANWCPTCRKVDATLKQPEIAGYLNAHFTLVKVNVGNFDTNMDISDRFGSVTKEGIPAMAIVDKNNSLVKTVKVKELAKMHKKGREAFYDWFKSL
jgi:thioredoxin 1